MIHLQKILKKIGIFFYFNIIYQMEKRKIFTKIGRFASKSETQTQSGFEITATPHPILFQAEIEPRVQNITS